MPDNSTERQQRRLARQAARKARKEARQARRAQRQLERQARREQRCLGQATIADKVAEKIAWLFDNEIATIKKQHQTLGVTVPSVLVANPPTIQQYLTNLAVEAIKLTPLHGFAGMMTIIPEIITTFKAQIRLLYDLALAHSVPEKNISKELLLCIYLHTIGQKSGITTSLTQDALIIYQSTKDFSKNAVRAIAVYTVGQFAKSLVCKWLPVVGSLLTQMWTHQFSNLLIGQATIILKKKIQFVDVATLPVNLPTENIAVEHEEADLYKLLTIINMMKQDGILHEKEIAFFDDLLANSDLDEDEKTEIKDAIEDEQVAAIDYDFFEHHQEEVLPLLQDLWAICQADGNIQLSELKLLTQFSERMKVSLPFA